MAWHKLYVGAGLASVVFGLSGCRWWHHASPQEPSNPVTSTVPVLREPVVPVGYTKIPPAPADSSGGILAQTATVFRGKLKDVQFTYDDCGGPRTSYVFSDASPLLGEVVSSDVNLSVLGGPTPRGTWLTVSETPKLALDSDYVVFLRNTDWTFSPIVADLAFRVEKIGGREALVHPSGRVLTGWDGDGPVLSAQAVSDPVGGAERGYLTATTPPRGELNTTGHPDTQGESPGEQGERTSACDAEGRRVGSTGDADERAGAADGDVRAAEVAGDGATERTGGDSGCRRSSGEAGRRKNECEDRRKGDAESVLEMLECDADV
jgi:hypothetical protein